MFPKTLKQQIVSGAIRNHSEFRRSNCHGAVLGGLENLRDLRPLYQKIGSGVPMEIYQARSPISRATKLRKLLRGSKTYHKSYIELGTQNIYQCSGGRPPRPPTPPTHLDILSRPPASHRLFNGDPIQKPINR